MCGTSVWAMIVSSMSRSSSLESLNFFFRFLLRPINEPSEQRAGRARAGQGRAGQGRARQDRREQGPTFFCPDRIQSCRRRSPCHKWR